MQPLNTHYHASATDYVPDCQRCPRLAFCGFVRKPPTTPGGDDEAFAALWSEPYCHSGITQMIQMVGPFCASFMPAHALAMHQRRLGHSSAGWLEHARASAVRENAQGTRLPRERDAEEE